MVAKICVGDYVRKIYHRTIFFQIGLGVSFLRMRDFASLGRKWLGDIFCAGGFLKAYRWDARTDFDEKYVKRRGSGQGSAFWGSRNQYLRFRPPFSPKPSFLGPISTGQNFFTRKRRDSKRP